MTQLKPFNFSATDLCVKCGLCLPHCPTYLATQNENESPRGRLALIDGWSRGQLKSSESLRGHLDRCLLCRACESVCPAKVPYGEIVDGFRQERTGTNKPSLPERLLLSPRRALIHHLLRLYQRSGLQSLLRFTRLIRLSPHHQLDQLLPTSVGPGFRPNPPAQTPKNGSVSLFTGCATETLDPRTLSNAARLIEHCGFSVDVPAHQPCCGALDQHAGRLEAAKIHQNQMDNCFKSLDKQALISVASGCGATLLEHPDSQISQRIVDISTWLLRHKEQLTFRPLNATAVLHTPCTLKNVMHQESAPPQLLKMIPQLTVTQVSSAGCCGAAGMYMLQQTEMANMFRDSFLEPLINHPPDYLLTSNIGCSLHLQAGLRDAGLATQVLHPVSLLAQQLIE